MRTYVHVPPHPGRCDSLRIDIDSLWESAGEGDSLRRSYVVRKLRRLLCRCRPASGRVHVYPRHWRVLAAVALRATCPDKLKATRGTDTVFRVTLFMRDVMILPFEEENQ